MIHYNFSLQPYNTFGIDVKAKAFAVFSSLDELTEILAYATRHLPTGAQRLILGGGSNILFTKNFDGIVLKNEWKGIELLKEDDEFYYVKAFAGEVWHEFVLHCIRHHYAGIENLSLIPGTVGASPMQNIGAYGIEIKDVLHELEAYHFQDKTIRTFNKQECEFGYRESVFKKKYKDQFVIISVTYQLRKNPQYHLSYGAIEKELEQMKIKNLSIRHVSEAVMNIRSRKLPNPATMGNAGSFFKNPVIEQTQFSSLQKKYPDMPFYQLSSVEGGGVKIPAAWLMEQCGWKGYKKNNVGCSPLQPLVLVNYGKATGNEIFHLSEEIIQSIKIKFGIELQREVNVF
jgi:UDP-N-acetylmuramate dehydrogenase